MRKYILFLLCLVVNTMLLAQEKMYLHKTDKITLGVPVSTTDSVYFRNNGTSLFLKTGTTTAQYAISEIDSISFGASSTTITVKYNGNSTTVVNPLAFEGVSVAVNAGDVTITSVSETSDINYSLSGTTSDGMFKIYSERKFNLILNGVNITNTDGPAINIQSSKKATVTTTSGTTNTLTDGSSYATSTEDQKSALFSEGQLVFDGTGNLTIKSNSKHGICSDDYISIENGTITVSGAAKDGVHASDYFAMNGGTLNVTATSDGIDCEAGYVKITGGNITTVNSAADVKSIASDSVMVITGGTLNMTVGGNQSKGLKAGKNMTLSGGTITINTSGAAVLESSGSGYDPAYCTAIKCDSTITISGSSITITSTGSGGKGISSDKNIDITSGTINIKTSGAGTTYKNASGITDSYSASCFSAANINITGGTVTTSSSGSGGKGFKADTSITIGDVNNSPTIGITTTGAKFIVSGTDYCHPKAMVCDGSITINNGNTTISSSDDGIHAEKTYTQNNGNVTINNSYEGVESYTITLNGGSLSITASNDAVNATAGTVSGGTESNDGSYLYVKGGTLVASCTNGDGIDSNGNLEISGGTVVANGPNNGVEEAVDFNGTFKMTGGLFIGAGSNSNMTKAMSTSSTQVNLYLTSSSQISSSTILHIQNAGGTDILSFKPQYGGYKFLFSSSSLTKGTSYSIYTGGSYTGGNSTNGLYTGGAYSSSGATLKKTVSLSNSSTVNTITF